MSTQFYFLGHFILYKNSEKSRDQSIQYKHYEKLDLAEIECRNDTECVGIYDEYCDKDGPFLQIKGGFRSGSLYHHCVYKKKRNEGTKKLNRTISSKLKILFFEKRNHIMLFIICRYNIFRVTRIEKRIQGEWV